MYKVCIFFILYPKEYRKSKNNDTIITIIFYQIRSYYNIIIKKYILFSIFFLFRFISIILRIEYSI